MTVAGLRSPPPRTCSIAGWPADVLAARHDLGPLSLPRLDTDLALAGLGLGLVVAPLSAAVLRASPAAQHGVASRGGGRPDDGHAARRGRAVRVGPAPVPEFTADLDTPFGGGPAEFAAYRAALEAAMRVEYREIFLITAALCAAGALVGLALSGRDRRRIAHHG